MTPWLPCRFPAEAGHDRERVSRAAGQRLASRLAFEPSQFGDAGGERIAGDLGGSGFRRGDGQARGVGVEIDIQDAARIAVLPDFRWVIAAHQPGLSQECFKSSVNYSDFRWTE